MPGLRQAIRLNRGAGSRMLKKFASVVLASFRPSTYPGGYASGLHSLRPCWTNFLSLLQECSAGLPYDHTFEMLLYREGFLMRAGSSDQRRVMGEESNGRCLMNEREQPEDMWTRWSRNRLRRGSIAWRFMPRNLGGTAGFTFIEIMVVVAILAILAALVVPRIMGRTDDAKRTAAKVQIRNIDGALQLYKLDHGVYPTTEQGLKALVEKPSVGVIPKKWKIGGYLQKLPEDPWGNPYKYLSPGQSTGQNLNLRS